MDYELRCPSCKDYYQSPVYLPCSHSMCYTCAFNSLSNMSIASDLDQSSLTSDNDSGISSSSRPCSLLLPPVSPKTPFVSQRNSPSTYLQCPTCSKTIPLDESDVKNLPKNRLLDDIVHRYHGTKSFPRQTHPMETNLQFDCLHCRSECCQDAKHEIRPLHQAMKTYKTQLSTQLQNLSEKAKCGAEFLVRLKLYPEYIKKNGEMLQRNLIKDIDNAVSALKSRKQDLLTYLDTEIERKISLIHQQYSSYNDHIQRTTGFLQFSIEALKHPDPSAYRQVCHDLNHRCAHLQESFSNKYSCQSHTSDEFDLRFNLDCLYRDIHQLEFQQTKPPLTPRFIPEQCLYQENSLESNSGVLTWSIHDIGTIQGFILELDQGTINSEFQEVYDGKETMCAIDGLHPTCVYTARLKSYNQAGESAFSECLTLHSSSVDWFTFNPRMSHPDIEFLSNDFHLVTCLSLQDRVVLGSRAFRHGIHYWQFTIERYDNKPDPAFGIAHFDVSKEQMLGKDSKSWCMYIDHQRSWFMHNGQHFDRIHRGISLGSVIGVLLDLNHGTLRFYIDDAEHGSIAFNNLIPGDVYYPAVSLNKNVHLTLVSELDR